MPAPSDLSSLYQAGVNIRAGNKLFIRSVPAFVNSTGKKKKRVNVQFCLRLSTGADKVSFGERKDVIKRQLFGSGLSERRWSNPHWEEARQMNTEAFSFCKSWLARDYLEMSIFTVSQYFVGDQA